MTWRVPDRALPTLMVAILGVLSLGVAATPASAAEPLSPYVSMSGEHLALSVDALGTNDPEGGPIMVQKSDAGETVRAAYLFAATTGDMAYEPKNGDVTLAGAAIEWEAAHTIGNDVDSYNAAANVTSIVKPVVDAASPGLVSFTVAEGEETAEYDGEILAVVLEDPAVDEARSLTLLYGAQNPLGDTFHVGLAEPIDKSNPSFALNLGLGISFGFQLPGDGEQYSIVKVNEKLMTSSAGGQDDCIEKYSATPDWEACDDGTLITAGGIGDSTDDPPDPEATAETCENSAGEAGGPRCDDELYSLLPFVENGESAITFNTDNPSDNDNIFFAALEVRGGAAVVGEGVTLSPTAGTNKVGEPHTLTASVQNEQGEPVAGASVHFRVSSGPNEGASGEAATSSSGKAQFTYSSSKPGVDHLVADFTSSHGAADESNEVSETWQAAPSGTGPPPAPSGGGPTPLPPPVLGKTVNVEPVSGKVYVALPSTASASFATPLGSAFASVSKGLKFIPLTEARQVPVGSTLEATAGVARLTTATATKGKTQEGEFGAGIFKLLQNRKQQGLTELNIIDNRSSKRACASVGKKAQTASKHLSSKTLGRLTGSAHGKFTTKGQYSAATVRGTEWDVSNQCDGTLTKVARGVVSVRDFRRRKTITLHSGQHYLARSLG
jgi:hypothetical protein